MKSIILMSGLFFAQSAFCQSSKPKADLKKPRITSQQSNKPHRNLNVPVIYTFIGNGPWSDAGNWDGNGIPPSEIAAGSEIRINSQVSGAKCILDIPYEIPNTTNTIKLTVYTGNQLVVPELIVK